MGEQERKQHAELLRSAFPQRIAPQVDAALARLAAPAFQPIADDAVMLSGEPVTLPYRVYYPHPPPRPRGAANRAEARILDCVYTRHHNGFVRQRHLERVLDAHEPWASPFILRLLGEYVVEILELLLAKVEVLRGEPCMGFSAENPAFVERTKRRIVSYWDCYYRSEFRRFRDYPGFRVADAIGWWRPRELPNIGRQ